MLIDIVEVQVVGDHSLHLRFEDGVEGVVELDNRIPFKGVFKKLKDPKYFATVKWNRELGTITWGCGADLAPGFLYELISRKAA